MYRAFEPVLVDARCQRDDVSFLEAQFAFVLRLEVIQCFTTRALVIGTSCRIENQTKSALGLIVIILSEYFITKKILYICAS